jgi:hypothetical protein
MCVRGFLSSNDKSGSGPTQPPIQYATGTLSLGVNEWGYEADFCLVLISIMCEAISLFCHLSLWHGTQLSTGTRTTHCSPYLLFHKKYILVCVISDIWHTFFNVIYSSIHTVDLSPDLQSRIFQDS